LSPQAELKTKSIFHRTVVHGFILRRIVVSNPSASRRFVPAGWIVGLAVLATLGIAVSAGFRTHRGNAAKQIAAATGQAPAFSAQERGRVRENLGGLPLAFEANQGQTDPQVKYMARGNGYTVFLTANDTVFALQSGSQSATRNLGKHGFAQEKTTPAPRTKNVASAIRMHLVGGNARPEIAAGNQLPGVTNYYIGSDRSQWQEGVKQFAGVSYRDVYPGVNMAFHGEQRQLEFDFIVAAGASPAAIHLGFSGARTIATDVSGNLLLSSPAGDVVMHKPVAYQEINGKRQNVATEFVQESNNRVAFALGSYDRSRELVIDPALSYATYLGGTAEDDGYSIAIDGSGNAYVTGQTESTDFPTVAGAYKKTNAGNFDVFVTKISADGSTLLYSTYVGGSSADSGNAIAVDGSGNAFVAGGTASSTDFPVTAGAKQTTFGGGSLDAFVFELASSGGSLTYSTYLGGSGTDVATGIALATDGSGDAFVVGSTGSTDFPVSTGAIQKTIKGTSNGFVTKLNSSGNALVYSTYLGGGTGDLASAVAVDSSNNAYVTGATQNATFPVTQGAFQTSCGTAANCNGGLSDAFIAVINAAGSGFKYSTFLGGSNADQGLGIAVDSSGDAYVTGLTQSNADFPTKNPLQSKFGGGTQDAFVTALNPTGSALLYSTYLGGSQADAGAGIAIDGTKKVYVTGQTGSSDFPVANATQSALAGGNDAFVTEINSSGSGYVFSTYLGGALNEDSTAGGASFSPVGAIAVDGTGANVYVTGNTLSTDFPATQGAKQTANAGGTDAFAAKYTQSTAASFTVANGGLSPTSGAAGVSATSTITVGSVNGFNSAVMLACTVAPVVSKGPTCSFTNPGNSVTPPANGTVTATLNVATTPNVGAMLSRPSDGRSPGMVFAMLLPVFGITLLGAGRGPTSRRRKLFGFLMLGMLLGGLLLLPACGGSNKGGGSTGTPPGAYTITVTGSSGGTVVTGAPALTLTVN
jgi:hypothetical protein